MKKFIIPMIAAAAIAIIPAQSFALVDVGAYGGYTFSGKADSDTGYKGPQYGLFGHLNMNNPLFVVGVGPYLEMGKFSKDSFDVKLKQSFGLDAYFGLNVVPVITPYARVGIALVDKWDFGGATETNYGKTNYFGVGFSKSLVPLVKIFAEYRYATSKFDDGTKLKRSLINGGLMVIF